MLGDVKSLLLSWSDWIYIHIYFTHRSRQNVQHLLQTRWTVVRCCVMKWWMIWANLPGGVWLHVVLVVLQILSDVESYQEVLQCWFCRFVFWIVEIFNLGLKMQQASKSAKAKAPIPSFFFFLNFASFADHVYTQMLFTPMRCLFNWSDR